MGGQALVWERDRFRNSVSVRARTTRGGFSSFGVRVPPSMVCYPCLGRVWSVGWESCVSAEGARPPRSTVFVGQLDHEVQGLTVCACEAGGPKMRA